MKNQKIQILRAFAIMAVVVIHSYPQTTIGIYIRAVVNFAVALFIFCSGYLTKLEYPSLWKFYSKRISRIGIPYLIWSLIYITLDYSSYGSFVLFLKNYLHVALHGTAIETMYFVIVYIGLVLFTPLIGKLAKSKWKHIGWLISPVYMVLKTYIPKLIGLHIIPSQLYFLQFLGWFTFYYLGLLLGNNVIQYKKSVQSTLCLYLLALSISLGEGLVWNHFGDYIMATTQGRLSCLFSSTTVCLIAYQYLFDKSMPGKNKLTAFLIMIGDYSFGIYLAHIFMMRILGHITFYKSIIFPFNSLLILLCTLLGLIAIDKAFSGKLNKLLGIK